MKHFNYKFRKYSVIAAFLLLSLVSANNSNAQFLYLGLNGGGVASWFKSPKIENVVFSSGWGWNMGFFIRYGKKPFLQFGFDWTRSINDFTIKEAEEDGSDFNEDIKFHEFDFSMKLGYNILDLPMFKVQVNAGPFIGRSLFFSTDNIIFEKSDFKNPQFGVIAGAGIQFTNFIAGFDYTYHFSDFFSPVDVGGETLKLGAHIQFFMIKVGFMF